MRVLNLTTVENFAVLFAIVFLVRFLGENIVARQLFPFPEPM